MHWREPELLCIHPVESLSRRIPVNSSAPAPLAEETERPPCLTDEVVACFSFLSPPPFPLHIILIEVEFCFFAPDLHRFVPRACFSGLSVFEVHQRVCVSWWILWGSALEVSSSSLTSKHVRLQPGEHSPFASWSQRRSSSLVQMIL